QGVEDHQGDELFREVIRPVVIGAVGDQGRQAVGALPSPHQVIGARLARGVRGTGRVGGGFGKQAAAVGQVTIDLVGGNVVEAKPRPPLADESLPVAARHLQQRVGTDDVGLNEGGGTINGAINVRLRR